MFKRALLFAAPALFVTTLLYAGMQPSEDEKLVRQAVDQYFNGVVKADAALLEACWDAPNAHMKYVIKDEAGKEKLKVVEIREAFQWWTKTPAPDSKGTVLAVDIVDGKLAVVKYEFAWRDKVFIDYLSLYKLNGQWKIVNKVFVTHKG